MSSEPRPGLLLPAAILAVLLLVGLLAPILATDRPLAAVVGDRLVLPAFADLPLVGPLFDAAAARGVDWATPPPGARLVLRAPVPYSDRGIRLEESLRPPDRRHPFGTDALGRDVLARCLHGARVSLLVGFGAGALALFVGCTLGAIAGLRGGGVDRTLVRLTDVMSCFPAFILALAFVAAWGRAGLPPLIAGIVLSRWTGSARLVRAETLKRRGGDLWAAARASGAAGPRLFLRHLLPLLAAPLSAAGVFGVAQAIILESGLSFAGLGVEPPTPSWGAILAEAAPTAGAAWWPVAFPAASLLLVLGALCAAAERLETAYEAGAS
jgi:peptide/nickel transport system permease protein